MKKRILRAVHLLVLGLLAASVQAAPQDVMLIVDNSGSMRKIDPGLLAKRAAAEFLQQLPEDFTAGVIIFDQNARLVMPLTPATTEGKAKLAASLESMNYRGLFTDSPAAIERAIFELKSKARPDAVKTIVFVSDGVVDTGAVLRDTERGKWLREELTVEAAASGIRIMPLAFTENADLLLIERLAEITHGEAIRAATPSDLSTAYGQMLERLKAPVSAVAATPPAVPAPPPVAEVPAPPLVEEIPTAPADMTPPTAEAPDASAPETSPAAPAPLEEPAPEAAAAPADDTAGAVALTAEEKAALEQLAKDTGVSVEQLMKELEEAPAGQAVVVRPEEVEPATVEPGSPLATNSLLLGAGVGGLLLAGLAWFFLRGKRAAPEGPAPTASAAAPASKAKPVEAFLIDVHGITSEPARRIGERQLIVGRTAGSDTEYLDYFVVNKATIGRRHAIIKFKDQMFWLVDQGSVNGTFVNNERVVGERMLKHGDRVKFHKFEFEFSYPDMADSNRTVVGISPDQTIVAAADATMSATTSALRAESTPFAATSKTAAVAAAATSAWLNKDALDQVPGEVGEGDPFDVTEEGDLDALVADRDDFFKSSGSQSAYVAPLEIAADAGDSTFDDEAAGTVALAGMRPLPDSAAADRTQVLATEVLAAPPSNASLGLDADASAFFDDGTVGPAPDLMRGPVPDLDTDLDVLDVTKVPAGIGDDDLTGNYAPPATVMRSPIPGERTGTKPPMDTGRFGELTTLSRNLDETQGTHELADDFIETGAFAARGTLLPERPSEMVGEATSVKEFSGTEKFTRAATETMVDTPSRTVSEDIFDVTGSPGDIPAQETVVLDNSPLHAKKDADPKPR